MYNSQVVNLITEYKKLEMESKLACKQCKKVFKERQSL